MKQGADAHMQRQRKLVETFVTLYNVTIGPLITHNTLKPIRLSRVCLLKSILQATLLKNYDDKIECLSAFDIQPKI